MKKETKSTFIFLGVVAFLALLAYLVLATPSESATLAIILPTSGTNYTTTGNLNITINNSDTAGASTVTVPLAANTTCYFGTLGGTWTALIGTYNNTYYNLTNETRYWVNVSVANVPDGVYMFNCTIGNQTVENSTTTANMASNITIDDTAPAVTPVNTNYSNASGAPYAKGLVTLNMSVIDATIGLHRGAVFFNLTNSTGGNVNINATGTQNFIPFYAENTTLIRTNRAVNATSFNISYGYKEGTYNITIYANDSLNNQITSVHTSAFRIDNTKPQVNATNITSPQPGVNYSDAGGLLRFNVSAYDVTGNINNVSFVVTNITGSRNATLTAGMEKSTDQWWSTSINVSSFPDGSYNVTVYVNDTAGNANETSVLWHTFIIDHTAPSKPSISFSPASTVDEGDTITATCTASDSSTTGIANSGMNSTTCSIIGTSTTNKGTSSCSLSPATTTSGTFTVRCAAQDTAGNTVITESTYSVSGGGAPSGGPGGAAVTPPTWTSTQAVTQEQFTQGYSKQLSAKQRLKISIDAQDHYVGVLSLTTTTATIEISSTPQQASLSVGDVRRFEVTGDSYYDIHVTLNKIVDSKADITIKSIHEEVTTEAEEEEAAKEKEATKVAEAEEAKKPLLKSVWFWVIVIVIIAIIAYIIYRKKR